MATVALQASLAAERLQRQEHQKEHQRQEKQLQDLQAAIEARSAEQEVGIIKQHHAAVRSGFQAFGHQ